MLILSSIYPLVPSLEEDSLYLTIVLAKAVSLILSKFIVSKSKLRLFINNK